MGVNVPRPHVDLQGESPLPQPVLDMLAKLARCDEYEEALRRIESFSVDNNDRGALWMGEVAREALSPWRDNDEAQKLIDAIHGTETCKTCGGRIDAPQGAMVVCTCGGT